MVDKIDDESVKRFAWSADDIVFDNVPKKKKKARKSVDDYVAEYQQQLMDMLDDDDYSDLEYTQSELKKKYIAMIAIELGRAAAIGLAGAIASKLLTDKLTDLGKTSVGYFDGFVDDLTNAIADRGDTPIDDVLDPFKARIATYAGTYWEAIWAGTGDANAERRVKRVLDPYAKHCGTCPAKEGIYDSFEAMEAAVGIPGDGSDDCLGNCRCTVLVETEPGSGDFQLLVGSPDFYTAPIIPVARLAA